MPKSSVQVNAGDKYNKLTVIKEIVGSKVRIFKVMCVCGTTLNVRLSNLRSGNTKSCGCLNKPYVKQGEIYNNLKVLEEVKSSNKNRRVQCICLCGNIKIYCLNSLKSGHTKSCGCLLKNNKGVETHGYSHHPLYSIWAGIKSRCYNENDNNYVYYGGRGIRMCKSWYHYPEKFINWCLEKGWDKNLELDRRNNSNGYKPSNCRLVTHTINMNNVRSNFMVVINDEKLTFANAIRKYGKVPYNKAYNRVYFDNWDAAEAIQTPA